MASKATLAAKEFDGSLRIGVNINGVWHEVDGVESGSVEIEHIKPEYWRVMLAATWKEDESDK